MKKNELKKLNAGDAILIDNRAATLLRREDAGLLVDWADDPGVPDVVAIDEEVTIVRAEPDQYEPRQPGHSLEDLRIRRGDVIRWQTERMIEPRQGTVESVNKTCAQIRAGRDLARVTLDAWAELVERGPAAPSGGQTWTQEEIAARREYVRRVQLRCADGASQKDAVAALNADGTAERILGRQPHVSSYYNWMRDPRILGDDARLAPHSNRLSKDQEKLRREWVAEVNAARRAGANLARAVRDTRVDGIPEDMCTVPNYHHWCDKYIIDRPHTRNRTCKGQVITEDQVTARCEFVTLVDRHRNVHPEVTVPESATAISRDHNSLEERAGLELSWKNYYRWRNQYADRLPPACRTAAEPHQAPDADTPEQLPPQTPDTDTAEQLPDPAEAPAPETVDPPDDSPPVLICARCGIGRPVAMDRCPRCYAKAVRLAVAAALTIYRTTRQSLSSLHTRVSAVEVALTTEDYSRLGGPPSKAEVLGRLRLLLEDLPDPSDAPTPEPIPGVDPPDDSPLLLICARCGIGRPVAMESCPICSASAHRRVLVAGVRDPAPEEILQISERARARVETVSDRLMRDLMSHGRALARALGEVSTLERMTSTAKEA